MQKIFITIHIFLAVSLQVSYVIKRVLGVLLDSHACSLWLVFFVESLKAWLQPHGI